MVHCTLQFGKDNSGLDNGKPSGTFANNFLDAIQLVGRQHDAADRTQFAFARISDISSTLSGSTTRSACPSRMKLASDRNDSISSGLVLVCIPELHHLQFTFAENLDPITQLSRLLKLKPLRRATHLDLEPRNSRFDVCRRIVLNLLNLRRHFEVVSLRRGDQGRFNRLHDRLRRDAVLAIELFLYSAPALRLLDCT